MVQLVDKLEQFATANNIPIIQPDGIEFLLDFIKKKQVKNILEIGTAIGYSAIRMASVSEDIRITTIEKDPIRYKQAIENITCANLTNQIDIILGDAGEEVITNMYDLVFLDGPKAQNIKYFNKYKNNLKPNGFIITDNLSFHGFVEHPETIRSKDLRALVRKITTYIEFLKDNKEFETTFLELGDGLSVSTRTKK